MSKPMPVLKRTLEIDAPAGEVWRVLTTPELIREWAAPDLGVERHYGYAFQWFALSALILILYLIANVRRNHET